MKKFLLLITAILTISLLGITGCVETNEDKANGSMQSRSSDIVQTEDNQDNCEDGDCNENEQPDSDKCDPARPCPRRIRRTPETSENDRRTSDTEVDGEPDDSEIVPLPEHHKPRKRHGGAPTPLPKPIPIQPKH